MTAGQSIGNLRSGANVTASQMAPATGTVTENDSTIFTQYTPPAIPASVRADILASAATARDSMQDDRDQTVIDIATAQSDLATQIGETASDIAEARTDLAGKVTAARAAAAATLVTITDNMTRALNDRAGLAAVALTELEAEIDAAHSATTTKRDDVVEAAKEQLKASHKSVEALADVLTDLDGDLIEARLEDHEAAGRARRHRNIFWEQETKSAARKFFDAVKNVGVWLA